jgi:hypothetical protein
MVDDKLGKLLEHPKIRKLKMLVNKIKISKEKRAKLFANYSDLIANISYLDNQQPSLDGNVLEGSTTGESLNAQAHDDNAHSKEVTLSYTPSTCVEQVVIQSELAGNCKR